MAQHRILTVDDDTGILRVLREILTRNGYDVVGAQDGAEALLRVRSRAFRLITMDLIMDRMDGVDTISVLQNESDAPILVVSAHLTDQTQADLAARGVTTVLDKPFNTEELLLAVSAAIASSEGK
jgi:DNA-binding response OmpR family regulator